LKDEALWAQALEVQTMCTIAGAAPLLTGGLSVRPELHTTLYEQRGADALMLSLNEAYWSPICCALKDEHGVSADC